MVADDHCAVGVLKRGCAGQQVKGRGGQRILIRPPVERLVQKLLGSDVTDGSDGDVVVGEVADVIDSASDAEVGEEHPAPVAVGRGHEDVLGLDVAMEQTAIMAEVEGIGDRRHDFRHIFLGHAAAVPLANQPTCVGAIDVVHRDPEPAVELATIENANNMGMPQGRGQFGLAGESRPELVVGRGG
jgi:hypothetical protein